MDDPMKPKAISRGIVLLVLFVFTSLGVGCASDKAVISQANQAHTGLAPAVIEDPVLATYIQDVGNRIIGAALGTLMVPFVLLPRLGLERSYACAVAGSLGVGLTAARDAGELSKPTTMVGLVERDITSSC